MANKLLRGTVQLSSASFISKILGFIYMIPLGMMIGSTGNALYRYAYGPYAIMISLSTMGIPLAISKMISKYNELERQDVVQRIFKSGILLMLASGFTAFLVLYMLSPLMARIVVNDSSSGNSLESVIFNIKLVSFALIIVPPMSFLRGYFQGHQTMGPPAVSTVVEQIARVIFILAGVFVTIKILHLSVTAAVGVATFAAFIGAIFGIAVLIKQVWKRRDHIFRPVVTREGSPDISIREIFKEIIQHSIPFVVMGMSLPLYQNIDSYSINRILMHIGFKQHEAEDINGVISYAQVLVLLPVSITTGLSVSIIPNMTKSFVSKNYKLMRKQMNQSFLVLMTIMLPAAFGMFALAEPLYYIMFPNATPEMGGGLLKVYAPAGLLIAIYGVTTSILQTVNQQKKAIAGLAAGLIVKLALNFILPNYYPESGFIIATYFGYLTSLTVNIIVINRNIGINLKNIKFRLISLIASTAIMVLVVSALKSLLIALFFPKATYVNELIVVIIGVLAGILAFGGVLYALNFTRIKKYIKMKQ
ncbi:putative polysaccharide biosynthesis protein [Peribacillus sp. B-H-3]|jgi:O-antigen/teichoic acid export membrane protein|uniref:putative polysaccharide biosynthesis protein n=1 Tax=Peribacillus sp. B-H-3 TaxID=3400420 RepID=UPI003B02ADF0